MILSIKSLSYRRNETRLINKITNKLGISDKTKAPPLRSSHFPFDPLIRMEELRLRHLSIELGIDYNEMTKLFHYSPKNRHDQISLEEYKKYLPCPNNTTVFGKFNNKQAVIDNLVKEGLPPKKKKAGAITLKGLIDMRPKPELLFWFSGAETDYQLIYFYLTEEDLKDYKNEKSNIPDTGKLLENFDASPPNPRYSSYLLSKYWAVHAVYPELDSRFLYDFYAASLLDLEYSSQRKLASLIIKDIGKHYLCRLTEILRAEAMEVEVCGYRFCRIAESAKEFISKDRLETLKKNVNYDWPYMYSEFSLFELYVYFTLMTDVFFAFGQPIFHLYSDIGKHALNIAKFLAGQAPDDLSDAISAIDNLHYMHHTTSASFLDDLYQGYNPAKGNEFFLDSGPSIASPKSIGLSSILNRIFSEPIQSWIRGVSNKELKYLVKDNLRGSEVLNMEGPSKKNIDLKQIEYHSDILNLKNIRRRAVDYKLKPNS